MVILTPFTLIVWKRAYKLKLNLHSKGGKEVAFRHLYTDCLMLLRADIHAFALKLQLYTLILRAEVGQSRHHLVIFLYGIGSLHLILSRDRAALNPIKMSLDSADWKK